MGEEDDLERQNVNECGVQQAMERDWKTWPCLKLSFRVVNLIIFLRSFWLIGRVNFGSFDRIDFSED